MMDANDLWPAFKQYMGMGATGATAVLMSIMWVRGNAHIKKLNEERMVDQKQYNKDMMKLQADNAKELTLLLGQYNQQITSLTKTIDELLTRDIEG